MVSLLVVTDQTTAVDVVGISLIVFGLLYLLGGRFAEGLVGLEAALRETLFEK